MAKKNVTKKKRPNGVGLSGDVRGRLGEVLQTTACPIPTQKPLLDFLMLELEAKQVTRKSLVLSTRAGTLDYFLFVLPYLRNDDFLEEGETGDIASSSVKTRVIASSLVQKYCFSPKGKHVSLFSYVCEELDLPLLTQVDPYNLEFMGKRLSEIEKCWADYTSDELESPPCQNIFAVGDRVQIRRFFETFED